MLNHIITKAAHLYDFGPFRVDVSKRILFREGNPVPLTSKVFDTLLVLIENSGRVIEKDELMNRVWPDTVVEENNLNVNISILRKALDESSKKPRFIVTIPARGYRFAAIVSELWDEDLDLEKCGLARQHNPLRAIPTVRAEAIPQSDERGSIVGFTSAIYPRSIKPSEIESGRQAISIAVLPFRRQSADETDEYLGVGLADALITRLSSINRLTVRPTSSILKYESSRQDATEAGCELNVDNVLEGSFQRVGNRIRVTAQFVCVRDGVILWAAQFNEKFTDIFAVEDSISEQVAAALTLKLTQAEKEAVMKRHTQSSQAYHEYLKGRFHWNKRTAEGLKEGMHHFREALREDARHAPAYSGLADSYIVLGNLAYLPPKEAFAKAKEGATQALKIDDTLAEAHASLGYVNWSFDWDWIAAEQEYEKAISLKPGYATTHQWYSLCLASSGRVKEAICEAQRAEETDPVSPIVSASAGLVFYICRQYDRAIAQCQTALSLDPAFYLAHLYLSWAYDEKGMHGKAIEEVQKSIILSRGGFMPLASLGYSYAASGHRQEAQKVLEQLSEASQQTYVPAIYTAVIYTALGNNDDAFKALERAHEERSNRLTLFRVDPRLDSLRPDRRYADLLQRVGL